MTIFSRLMRPVLLCVIVAAAPLVYADEVMDRLVRLVGRDAGLCVEVPHLDESLTAFEQSEFFQRLVRSKIYAEWRTGIQHRKLAEIAAVVEKHTGKPARQFIREVFGTAVVVAAYAEPGPRMSAILMSEATSRETLESALAAWNRVEPPQIETITFSTHTYFKRTCAPKPGRPSVTLYYATLDRILLLSDREELVRRTLALSDRKNSSESVLDLAEFQQARLSLGSNCAARAYLNPRAFDAMLSVHASGSETSRLAAPNKVEESPVCRTIQAAWRRCEWLALGVQIDRGIVVEGIAQYRTNGMSETAMRLIHSMAGPAELMRLAPPDAFVVLACRQPFGTFLRHLLIGQAKEQPSADWESFRQVSRGVLLGLDLIDDVLPSFRENIGGYLVPRSGAKPGELPFDGLLAAELPSHESSINNHPSPIRPNETGPKEPALRDNGPAHGRPTVRDAVDNGLNMTLNAAAAYFNMRANGTPAIVRTEIKPESGTHLRWLEGLGPYRPAYGMTPRYLVLSTSPQAVMTFAKRESEEHARPAAQAASGQGPAGIAELAARYFPKENQILYIDTVAIRRFLDTHGQQLIEHAVRVGSIPPAHAEKALAKFVDVTGLFDAVFVAARLGDGSARLVIGGIVNVPATAESTAAR
jgi:hypothetical protein